MAERAGYSYPLLFFPKRCSSLRVTTKENILIGMKIILNDSVGRNICMYAGKCNVRVVDDTYIQFVAQQHNSMISKDERSELWVESFENSTPDSTGVYLVHKQTKQITKVKDKNYLAENTYDYTQTVKYTPLKTPSPSRHLITEPTELLYKNYKEDEYECGVFLSQLSEAKSQNNNLVPQTTDEQFLDETKSEALEQLVSLDTDWNKQSNTIVFTGGRERENGGTVQMITVNDPVVQCRYIKRRTKKNAFDSNKKKYQCGNCDQCFDTMPSFKRHMINRTSKQSPKAYIKTKQYLDLHCQPCKKRFKSKVKFDRHCLGHGDPSLECNICFKVFATKSTMRTHQLLHRRSFPCNDCSRTFSLYNDLCAHQAKSHQKFRCEQCFFATDNYKVLEDHWRVHFDINTNENLFNESVAEDKFVAPEYDLISIEDADSNNEVQEVNNNACGNQNDENAGGNYPYFISNLDTLAAAVGSFDNMNTTYDMHTEYANIDSSQLLTEMQMDSEQINQEQFYEIDSSNAPNIQNVTVSDNDTEYDKIYQVAKANNIMDKVRTNYLFFTDTRYKRQGKNKHIDKTCNICTKSFDRLTDLKRHVIQHIVECTLAKNPISGDGTLALVCEFCDSATFNKIETYKAHLRAHAKLTTYHCQSCDKSFSDSSNFAKHKKVHSDTKYFQCDLCMRKFNTKKMIIQHLDLHKKTLPQDCKYCGKTFYFESMLKKHCKNVHSKLIEYRCKFCTGSFYSLKAKWEHEWKVHSSRKAVIDCWMCKCKFRKYNDLKKHCAAVHSVAAPRSNALNFKP